ncbi:DUF7824 domain-containing protein [Actinoplanes sichuanensis]|uniref:DUF7824 domain-containing protein n=1 Tax=Actinoplanes sichuanensis TaxID=512349 RepID=UPI0029535D75|nr:DUF6493 family protein [Actinoplanes sichuanensis]
MIASVSTPARAATLLNRRGMRDWREISTADFLRIARARRLPWIGDLGVRLARVLSSRDVWGDDWRFVEALLIEGDAQPPVTEGVVRGWVQAVLRQAWSVPLADTLRGSPWLDLLLPSVFEIDGLGGELPSADFGDHELSFPEAVARLVAEGRLERRVIVDATADRLARGDRPGALRPFALLHEALAPAADELARHTTDYARLAGDAPSPVARIALSALRTLGEHGLLEIETVVDAGAGVLARKEKVLVKAGLAWLDETARRSPDRAGEILETVAVAFDHQSLDIQERAFAVAARHLAHAPAGVAARLAAIGPGLLGDAPPDRAADRAPSRAAGAVSASAVPASGPFTPASDPTASTTLTTLTTSTMPPVLPSARMEPPAPPSARVAPPAPPSGRAERSVPPSIRIEPPAPPSARVAPLAPPSARAERSVPPSIRIEPPAPPSARVAPAGMPAAIGSAAELAEEVTALIQDPAAVRWERILAALVSLPSEGFAESLGPVLDRHPSVFGDRWGRLPFLGEAISARLGRERGHVMRERLRHTVKRGLADVTSGMTRSLVSTPSGILTHRVAEVAVQVTESDMPVPALLATPTDVTGTVDAGVLVDRLARYAEVGADPWPLDLQQAMIRMSRNVGPEVSARADALTSPSGKLVAGWLRSGGLPDPVSARFEQCSRDQDGQVVTRRVVVTLESGRAAGDRILLEDTLVNLTPKARPEYYVATNFQPDVLAMVMPQHREAVAAWALTDLAALADQDGRDAALLPLLADAAGPVGPATVHALLYGLAARYETDRVAAVDAFLSLTADPELSATINAAPSIADPGKAGGGPDAAGGRPSGEESGGTGDQPSGDQPSEETASGEKADGDKAGEPGDHPGAGGGQPGGDKAAGGEAGAGGAGGSLFTAALGAALGDLAADGTIKLARVVTALRDAHQAGASDAVWQVLRCALPLLLSTAPRGLPDLLELATRTASAAGARDAVPGLPEMAARGGGTRVVREAKRLQATLTH